MKKLLSFLCLVGILFAFQAKLNAIPTYLVIDLETRASRYTDEAPDLRNDTCRTTELWLRYIPAGTFTMGSPVGEDGREDPSDETQHRVTLSQPYYIGVFEVTQAQWEAIMNFGAPIVWGGETIPARPSYFKNDEHYATRPVESVSYYMIRGEEAGIGWPDSDEVDDLSFMGLLRELTGLKFDLPTEAQWEYACRAGTTTALNSGKALFDPEDEVENMDAVGRYMYNSGFYKDFLDDERNRELSVDEFGTAKVGSYAPNAWGLYDMHGNVVEWCLDWFYGDDYSTDDVTDPVGEEFDSDLEVSVCRGGSWCSEPYKCRSAFRGIFNSYADDYENGFRLVCLTMPETHTVTVANGTSDKAEAYAGDTVTITADNPPDGMVFDKWESDDVTFDNANDAETTFQMPDKAVTVTATYKNAPKYKVDVRDGRADMYEAYPGQTVTITANEPDTGMFFYYWQSGVTFADEYDAQTTFVMPARDVIVSPVYTNVPRYKVTVVNGKADKKIAREGEKVEITADEPPSGKVFSHWTSNSGVTFMPADNPTTTFRMPGKYVFVKANWKNAPKYEVTVENGIADEDEYEYAEGETVKITADNPPVGKVFDKWTSEDDDVPFDDPTSIDTTFTMPAHDVTVTATYKDLPRYTVTVMRGTADKEETYAGDIVSIAADFPIGNVVFDRWTSNDNVTFDDEYALETTFVMPNKAVAVTATYKEVLKFMVMVENGTTKKEEAAEGETVEIKANNPPDGKVFDHWVCEIGGVKFADEYAEQTTFTMPGKAVRVQATYKDAQKYSVTVENGTAQPSQTYEGDTVEIEAQAPAEHKLFDKWTSEDGVTFANPNDAKTTFTMLGKAVTVTATYKDAQKYTVTVVNGTAQPSQAYEGETVEITANTPAEHKLFDQWTSDDVTFDEADNARTTFVMPPSEVIVTANYIDEPIYTVTVRKGTANPSKAYAGQRITIKAETPSLGSVFVQWTGEGVTIRNANEVETTFIMPANDVTVTAYYQLAPKFEVTVEYGSADKTQTFEGDTVAIEAQAPAEHKLFDKWTSEDGVTFTEADNARTTFRMLGKAVKVTATYKDAPTYMVTVENGTADKTEAYAGETVTITANNPSEHKLFDQWTSDDVTFDEADNARTTFRMPAENVAVTANYIDEPIYTVTVRNGTANPSKAYAGQRITIKANTPSPGSVFAQWTGEGVTIRNANEVETTFIMPANDVTVTAYYQLAPKFAVTVEYGSADKTQTYEGDTVEIEAQAPAEHKLFDKWTSEDDVTFADPNVAKTTFTMLGKAVTVTATYKDEPIYTVTVTNGTADPQKAYAGDEVTITANDQTANHLLFDSWTGDVDFVSAENARTTFVMPAEDVAVTATYKDEPIYTVEIRGGMADKKKAYAGEKVSITAEDPEPGMVFDHWWDGNLLSPLEFANPNLVTTTFFMPARDVQVSSVYSGAPTFTVTVTNGTANPSEAYAGQTVKITANDQTADHLLFNKWTGDVTFAKATSAETTFVMPANAVTVEATYKDERTYRVTVKNGTADKTEAYAGETVTIEAKDPAEHYQFGSWTGAVDFAEADAAKTTFVMPGNNVTVTATYQEDAKYTVTVVGGKASKKTAYEGEEITITANKPASGNAFDAWSGDVDFADATATPTTFTMPANNVTVTATFKTVPKTYKIVVVNGTADMAKAAAGEIVTLTANNPPAGKVFDRWTGGAVFDDPNSPTTTFIMPAKAVTPKALYKRK